MSTVCVALGPMDAQGWFCSGYLGFHAVVSHGYWYSVSASIGGWNGRRDRHMTGMQSDNEGDIDLCCFSPDTERPVEGLRCFTISHSAPLIGFEPNRNQSQWI